MGDGGWAYGIGLQSERASGNRGGIVLELWSGRDEEGLVLRLDAHPPSHHGLLLGGGLLQHGVET